MENCATCANRDSCSSVDSGSCPEDAIQKEALNEFSSIKKVIAVMSGKGGVGKSMVTSSLACELAAQGLKVGILDADITGPSIPAAFGLKGDLTGNDTGINPMMTKKGIPVISINLMLENPTDPVVWRGPILGGVIKQFWSEVNWGMLDVLLIDMPPGTGDVPLTVFQSLPVDGAVLVATPQDLVSMIVKKALTMANMMGIPVLGMVENMSFLRCPDCGKEISIFGKGMTPSDAASMGTILLDRVPLDPIVGALIDAGKVEDVPVGRLPQTVSAVSLLLENVL